MSNARDISEMREGQVAKAWVNFDGRAAISPFTDANGGIRNSFNVSSVTDNGVGNYTVNLQNSLEDSNYCIAGSAGDTAVNYGDRQLSAYPLTSSTCRVITGQTATVNTFDSAQCNIVIYR